MNKLVLKYFYLTCIILTICLNLGLFLTKVSSPIIRSDGFGYYSYLPSIFIYNEINFEKVLLAKNTSEYYLTADKGNVWTGITPYKDTNTNLNKYTIGTAVLQTPFFLLSDLTVRIINDKRDGLSSIYQLGIMGSFIFYFLLGTYFLKTIFECFTNDYNLVKIVILCTVLGTNLYHYSSYDGSFSHIYSYFLVNLIVLISLKLKTNIRKRNLFLLGLASGLLIITRVLNSVFLIIPIILLFDSLYQQKIKFSLIIKHVVIIILGISIPIFLQVIYWKLITGSFIIFSYGGESFNFNDPKILEVLFSVRRGLFFWSPLTLLSIVSAIYLIFNKFKDKLLFFTFIIFFMIHTFLISTWWSWTLGGGFGHRGYTEFLGFPFIALLIILNKIKVQFIKYYKYALLIVSILIIINILLMIGYWIQIVPIDIVDNNSVTQVFGYVKGVIIKIFNIL